MLKITKTVEYALIAVRHINNKNSVCSSREISSSYNIPHEIMAKTLQKLCKIGYIYAVKGSHGGYYLNISIDKVNLIEFIENIEGPVGIVQCSTNNNCDLIKICNIKAPIHKINNNIRKVLSKVSLYELAN